MPLVHWRLIGVRISQWGRLEHNLAIRRLPAGDCRLAHASLNKATTVASESCHCGGGGSIGPGAC